MHPRAPHWQNCYSNSYSNKKFCKLKKANEDSHILLFPIYGRKRKEKKKVILSHILK